jgi:HNH endonuclease
MGTVKRPKVPPARRSELLARAGDQCAICHLRLKVSDDDGPADGEPTKHEISIAEAAHIIPVSPQGERGAEPRPVDINDIANLVALCPNCHTMVDKPRSGGLRWPMDKLRRVKTEHEAWIAFDKRVQAQRAADPDRGRCWQAPQQVRPGDRVTVDGQSFWLAPPHKADRIDATFRTCQSGDGSATCYTAYGYAEAGAARHVWLRRVTVQPPSPDGDQWRVQLIAEASLLTGVLPRLFGLPKVIAVEVEPTEATVLTGLLAVRTAQDRFGDGKGTTEEAVRALLNGVAPLCSALSALHAAGFAHGDLAPGALLTDQRGRLALRDLGHALRADHGGSAAADTRTLAAIVYQLATGFPPAASGPTVPAAALNPALPESAATALDQALANELRDVRTLGLRLSAQSRRPS